ncbi:MAG TPA: cytochrome c oxidase subunit II [Candidatus Xenobia bacterium]|nr:cytochrome c oxidase subunit II [Candidatus Xenobia bacterium]
MSAALPALLLQAGVPLFPEQASSVARHVDALYFYLTGVTIFFTVLIFSCVFYFAIRYRRRSEDELPKPIHGSLKLEIIWSVVPLVLVMVMFFWGATLYFHMRRAPADATQLFVVGKQWMWKIQHPDGQREINQLHVPVGRPIKLTMTSEDVIHSFYIPAFRIKMDVLPGRYTELWFTATRPGEYHLFCAEYCGTKHSGMIGRVVVMEPADYENWLAGSPAGETLEQAGARLFRQFNCHTCHEAGPTSRGPSLHEIFGKSVRLKTGATVTVDESYLRESILLPNAKVVAGYEPVMPTYQGLASEEQVMQLIAYIKSLTRQEGKAPTQ